MVLSTNVYQSLINLIEMVLPLERLASSSSSSTGRTKVKQFLSIRLAMTTLNFYLVGNVSLIMVLVVFFSKDELLLFNWERVFSRYAFVVMFFPSMESFKVKSLINHRNSGKKVSCDSNPGELLRKFLAISDIEAMDSRAVSSMVPTEL